MIGSIVIETKGEPKRLPLLVDADTGNHTPGRDNGRWYVQTSYRKQKVYVPQRDSNISLYTKHGTDLKAIVEQWTAIQGLQKQRLEALRQLLLDNGVTDTLYMNTEGDHGPWSIVTTENEVLNLTLVSGHGNLQLVFGDVDVIASLRRVAPTDYLFYRMPSPSPYTFLHTQAICSRWWRWRSRSNRDLLKCANSLEVFVHKR